MTSKFLSVSPSSTRRPVTTLGTSKESQDLVLGFLKMGRNAGEKCVYLGPPDETGPLSEALLAGGIDVERAQASDQLVLHEGASDPEELKDLLRGAVEDIPRKFPLLRWVGEMTWSLKAPDDREAHGMGVPCNCVGDPKPVFLCQYDLTAFQGNVVMDALRTHSVCIVANVSTSTVIDGKPRISEHVRRGKGVRPLE